jgi:hypothetical protein
MTGLQKTFKYDGSNAAIVGSDFPTFADVKLEFVVPTYQFLKINFGKSFAKSFTKNVLQKHTVPLQSSDYSQAIVLETITGYDYQTFLSYYGSFLRFNNPDIPFNFQKFREGLQLLIETKINVVHSQAFSAMPFVPLTGDRTLLSSGAREHGLMLAAPTVRNVEEASEAKIKKYLSENLVLLNLSVLDKIIEELNDVTLDSLTLFLSFSIKDGNNPVLSIPTFADLNQQVSVFGRDISDFVYNQLKNLVTNHFDSLFDFPITVSEIKPVAIKGNVTFLGTESVIFRDLSSYDLIVNYQFIDGVGTASKNKSIDYKWTDFSEATIPDRSATFDFQKNNDFVFDAKTAENITVSLKLFDGTVLWTHQFESDDVQLGKIHIEVPLLKASQIGGSSANELPTNLTLKGKVVEATGKCSLKDLTVIIQAKAKKEDLIWKVVGVATTDITGSFSMPYPLGVYEDAQAIVSITPDSPVGISVNIDDIHKAALQTISNDFLYLLVDGVQCTDNTHQTDDCDCHATNGKTPRLPGHEELIGSDKFSQDLGGGTCVNLTTPNRTLSEQSYYAIVRTSDPDIANYVLQKNTETDQDGFQKVKFTLGDGVQITRDKVSLENAIRWQDAPYTTDKDNHLSIYQAVSVAHGHLLHYKSVLKADGYSLGDLLYSLPLAPGQKKQIVVYDWKRSLQASESQQLTQREGLNASVVNDRSIIDDLSGNISEYLRGQSSANTGGVSAGLGIGAILGPVGGVLGVSGGYSSSSSKASQDSSRNTVQAFSEVLRNSITQSASSYRELNGTLIDTVTEGQQFSTSTEVIANHNHCHSLTMLYFEVLRHYAVYQELAQVEECIFVPLIMTNFSMENIHKWRDVLAASLLRRPSNTYLPYFGNRNPLIRAFDANDRVMTNWANVDFPTGRYCDEPITSVSGYMTIKVNVPRPKTFFDRIMSFPVVKRESVTNTHGGGLWGSIVDSVVGENNVTKTWEEKVKMANEHIIIYDNFQEARPADVIEVVKFDNFFLSGSIDEKLWTSIANLLKYSNVSSFLSNYFSNKTISQWDRTFYEEIAPKVFEELVKSSITISPFSAIDFTNTTKYYGGERLIRLNLRCNTSLTRAAIDKIKFNYTKTIAFPTEFWSFVTFIIENININYTTRHYTGTIINQYLGDGLFDGTLDITTLLNSEEQRNPRKEDKFIVNELITHLNSNLEHYNKALWYNLDIDRRYLLLDGFHIQVYNDLNLPSTFKSLASIVKNQMIGIAGNSLIFPVAAGVKVDRSYLIVSDDDGNDVKTSLFDHYRPLTPAPPYRISVPTRGVYAEAVQGNCDACEKVKDNSSQDWEKFKTDEPTAIGTVTIPTPTPTDWKANFKDFATPIVNIQNAPAAPAPGIGLAGLAELLGKSDVFKDITGLDGNQKNAMATYLSNQENAKAFASMAKDMAMQAHNTQNADKIKGAIGDAQSSGAISKEDASKLTKDHIQQMIDGGESKKAEAEQVAAAKPSLTDAAVNAVNQGKAVKAENTNATTGKTEKVEIEGNSSETILAKVNGLVPKLKQDNEMSCWATAATIMVCWKQKSSVSVTDVLALAGEDYVQKFNNGEGLQSSEKEAFITALDMMGEPPASYTLQQYIDWVKTYGPLWVTTDSSTESGVFSPHARILIQISGAGPSDEGSTFFTFIDPVTGTEVKESFTKFLSAYQQMVTDNDGDLFIQIVHFNTSIAGDTPTEGGSGKVKRYPHALLSAKFHEETEMFDDAPIFIDQTNWTAKKDVSLQTALETLIDGNAIFKGNKSKIQIAIVNLNDVNNPIFAGIDETKAVYGASSTKIGAFYAAHQLLFDIRDFIQNAIPESINTKAKLLASLKVLWGKNRNPDLNTLFKIPAAITSANDIQFSDYFKAGFANPDTHNDNALNGNLFNYKLISALSFEYIGSVLYQSGLFNKKTKGLWVNWRYGGVKKTVGDDGKEIRDTSGARWNSSPFNAPTASITALSSAIYFTLLAQQKMAFSAELSQVLALGCNSGVFAQMPSVWSGLSTTKVFLKCGLDEASVHDIVLFDDDKKKGAIIILTENNGSPYLNPSLFKALYDILPNR